MIRDDKKNLIGCGRAELDLLLSPIIPNPRERKMRMTQIWAWIYKYGAQNFEAMTNVSKPLRLILDANFTLARPEIVTLQLSKDGTRKYLLRFADGQEAETVYIPDRDRGTLCISSQVGCTLNCTFCHTGTQKLVRNLTAHEIVAQIMVARDDLEDWEAVREIPRKVTNVVLMGMGEPLYNFEHVRDAVKITMDGEGLSLSRRRITLSTSGIVPEIVRVGEEIGCLLAISFHATTDEIRNELVPINKKWNIKTLLDACRAYPRLSNSERITFEYVMLRDINDTDEDARRLVRLIAGIPAKINLIPFNLWPGSPYERSTDERIARFAKIVMRAGYASPVRKPRGEDILAACGQLKSQSIRVPKSISRLALNSEENEQD